MSFDFTSFLIRVLLGFVPVGLEIFVNDILNYTRVSIEGLAYSESYEIILARVEVLSFLTSFMLTSLLTALNNLLLANTIIAIIWLLSALLTALSLRPLVMITQPSSNLYKAKEWILKKKPLLVVATFVAVIVTELIPHIMQLLGAS